MRTCHTCHTYIYYHFRQKPTAEHTAGTNMTTVTNNDSWLDDFIAREYNKKVKALEKEEKKNSGGKERGKPQSKQYAFMNKKVTPVPVPQEQPIPVRAVHLQKKIICECCGEVTTVLADKGIKYSYKGGTTTKMLRANGDIRESDWDVIRQIQFEIISVEEVVLCCDVCYSAFIINGDTNGTN
jgi:hypothetical protein